MPGKHILAALAVVFLALALVRLWKDGFHVVPASRTWLLVGAIIAAVSFWIR